MRVAVTVEQCWHRVPGGTARAVLDLLGGLRDRSDVDVVGVAARHRDAAPEPWVPPVPVHQLPFRREILYATWARIGWPDVESASGPVDVVHSSTIIVPGHRAPLVVTVHDLAWRDEPDHFTKRGVRAFEAGLRAAHRHAALVVCPSDATAKACEAAGFTSDRIVVVPWGHDPIEVDDDELVAMRAKYQLDRPYVLFTGTVEPRKNLAGVLEAFRRLERDDLDLVIAGPEGWHVDLDELEAGISHVRRLGFVPQDDLPALMKSAAVLCSPSLREGFGLPVLEAMAQGTPAVTSAGTSTAEIVGDAGVLVDPLDVDAIAAGIARVIGDHDLRRRARDRAATFTVARCADGYVEAYQRAAAR